MNVNRVTFGGNLTRDPELRTTSGGTDIAKWGMAANEYAGSDKPKRTTFIDCVAFGKTALNIVKYFKKGSPMLFFGRIDYSTWKTDAGENRSKVAFVVEKFEFCGDRADSKSSADDNQEVPF